MRIVFTLTLSLVSLMALCQPTQYSLLLNRSLIPCDSADAKFIRNISAQSDSLYKVVDFRLSDKTKSLEGTIKIDFSSNERGMNFNQRGKEKRVAPKNNIYDKSAFEGRHIRHGLITTYYPNKIVKSLGTYIDGDKTGEFKYWYQNGVLKETLFFSDSIEIPPFYRVVNYFDSLGNQLVKEGNGVYEISNKIIEFETGSVEKGFKNGNWTGEFLKKYVFKESYKNGILESGMTSDSLGNQYPYEELEVQAEYNGGFEALYRFVGSNLRYPAKARRKGLQGRVFVEFIVDKQGNTTEVKVIKGFYPECDERARLLIESANNFTPGKMKGIDVKQRMILPITFKLH